jgi:hypothetical protein
VKGILADVNIEGNVQLLVKLMAAEPWQEFWHELQIPSLRFADVGLAVDAIDSRIWRVCQAEELVLLTGNRNARGPDSLQETIRLHNSPTCLPVLTLADPQRLFHSREYVDRVIDRLLDYLERIEDLRGAGRLFLP